MILDSDHHQLAQAAWDATHHGENGSFDDAPGHVKHIHYATVAAILTELDTMGYVVAKLEGKVS